MKIADKAIHHLLSGLASGRVYLMRAPQNATAPFIVFQEVDSSRWRSINAPSGIAQSTFQIDTYSQRPYEAKELAADVEEILDGYADTVFYGSDSPQDFLKIAGITLQSAVDLVDQTDEPLLFRKSVTYTVTYYQGA
jgi:hypothetical protein